MKTMPTFSLTSEVWCNYEVILRSNSKSGNMTDHCKAMWKNILALSKETRLVLAHYAKGVFCPKVSKNKIPVLPQPSHTQDLSPANIFLFPKL
jgi:hypothetical protein